MNMVITMILITGSVVEFVAQTAFQRQIQSKIESTQKYTSQQTFEEIP